MCGFCGRHFVRGPEAGFFLTRTDMSKRSSIFQPLSLAAILALGLGFAIGIVVIWCIQLAESRKFQKREKAEEIAVLYDGTPVITVDKPYHEIIYRDLEHKTISPKKSLTEFNLEHVMLAGPANLEPQQIILASARFPLGPDDRIQPFSPTHHSQTYWYFIDDGKLDGRGYFMAFDRESKHCIGYLGMRGFSTDLPQPDDWFPMDGRKMETTFNATRPGLAPCVLNNYEGSYYGNSPANRIAMISGDRLFLIDLQGRSITTVMKSADMISVSVMKSPASLKELPVPDEQVRFYVFVRTTDGLIQFDLDGKQVGKYSIPEDFRKKSFDLYYLGDEKALIVQDREFPDRKGGARLAWLEADGKIVQTKEVILAGKEENEISDIWKVIVVTPEPISTIVEYSILWAQYFYAENKEKYISEVNQISSDAWLPVLALCIVSAALAWFCYQRQRRMALPGVWYWVGFVFLGGVPGYFAY